MARWFAAVLALGAAIAPLAASDAGSGLEWESRELARALPAGTSGADFVFVATNRGSAPVAIAEVSTSCDCLVAAPPARPWVVAPGGTVRLEARLDLVDRSGTVRQEVWVRTDRGRDTLRVVAELPRRGAGSR